MTDRFGITPTSVLGILGGHVGKGKGITGERLAMKVTGATAPDRRSERLVRKAIETLRDEGFHICGTPDTGYFMAANAEELDRTCLFLYSRAMASLKKVARMKKVSLPDLRGQLKLPT